MIRLLLGISMFAVLALPVGCKQDTAEEKPSSNADGSSHAGHDHEQGEEDGDGHHEDDGHDHGEHDGHDHASNEPGDGHGHGEEADLGTVEIGGMKITAAQGHGKVAPGKESHLVVKLPYNDKGSTVVRAWLGTSDRTLSMVGRGEYAASHDDYDVHAMAPHPLPEGVMWWIEIQKPDGSKAIGAIKPLLD